MFNDVLDKKQTFFDYKEKIFQSPKTRIFPKRNNPCIWRKKFFLYLDLVKIKLELIFNNFVEKKETFFDYKENLFKFLNIAFFQRG